MLLRQCDSCEKQTQVSDGNRIPASWAFIAVEYKTSSKAYFLCGECFELPMTFGKLDMKF